MYSQLSHKDLCYNKGVEDAKKEIARGNAILPLGRFNYSQKKLRKILEDKYQVQVLNGSDWNKDYYRGFSKCMKNYISNTRDPEWWYIAIDLSDLEIPPPT